MDWTKPAILGKQRSEPFSFHQLLNLCPTTKNPVVFLPKMATNLPGKEKKTKKSIPQKTKKNITKKKTDLKHVNFLISRCLLRKKLLVIQILEPKATQYLKLKLLNSNPFCSP